MSLTGAGPAPPTRPAPAGERRVTLDVDDADPLDLVRAWKALEAAGCYDLEARVSSSCEGAHVRGWLDADDADEQLVEQLRLAAGDDPKRVDGDRQHHIKPGQVLFEGAAPWRSTVWAAVDDLRRLSSRHSTGWSA